MLRSTWRRLALAGLAAAALTVGAAPAQAVLYTFTSGSHPDGTELPPPYGLRLDGIESFVLGTSNNSDTWTFDFDCAACSITAAYDTVTEEFTLAGTAFGGKDGGGTYASSGFVDLLFSYDVPLAGVDLTSGFPEFSVSGAGGTGTITFTQAIGLVPQNTKVGLAGKTNEANLNFSFQVDQHRVGPECGVGTPPAYCALPVGFGWLQLTSVNDIAKGTYHTDSQDWLFVNNSVSVPEPATLALLGGGLLGMGIALRRRPGLPMPRGS